MQFEFASAGRIIFGSGKRRDAFAAAREFGSRALLVTGSHPERFGWLREGLSSAGIETEVFSVPGEPAISRVEAGAEIARGRGLELVIAIGGGSVIDAGKGIAALATNEGDISYYLEVIGGGKPLHKPSLPVIALPTTAGTGAEVTRNAVLFSPEHRLKVSLRSPMLLPRLAIVDSELTYDLPREITAFTGMDALTQLIEPFLCARPNPLTDAICREALPRAARALPRAVADAHDHDAREEMALASLCGGLALANSGLGAVHGIAAPLGGMFSAPHGAICAALLPHVLRVNCAALSQRAPNSRAHERFDELGALLTGHRWGGAGRAIRWVENLSAALGIRGLSHWGVRPENIAILCARAEQASSMKANPVPLTPDELASILQSAL